MIFSFLVSSFSSVVSHQFFLICSFSFAFYSVIPSCSFSLLCSFLFVSLSFGISHQFIIILVRHLLFFLSFQFISCLLLLTHLFFYDNTFSLVSFSFALSHLFCSPCTCSFFLFHPYSFFLFGQFVSLLFSYWFLLVIRSIIALYKRFNYHSMMFSHNYLLFSVILFINICIQCINTVFSKLYSLF